MFVRINHLTRMSDGHVCVAGVEPGTSVHIRPVLLGARLRADVLRDRGGPFDMGALVDLGPTRAIGHIPETEDHEFQPAQTRFIHREPSAAFWRFLNAWARPSLREIFGPDLYQHGRTCALDVHAGCASLGCLVPQGRPDVYVSLYGRVRIALQDGEFNVDAAVTDLRLYEADQTTPRRGAVRKVQDQIRRGVPIVLSVGLTRPWQKEGECQPRHWLQVNNIHLEARPDWQLTLPL